MSGKPTRQSKQLIIILKSFIQRSNQTAVGSREPSWWKRETGRWEEKKKRSWREKSQQNEVVWRLALWWQSQWKCKTGCGRSLLPGQQSPSPLFVSHGLGTDGTLLPHGRHYRDLQRTSGQDLKYWPRVLYLQIYSDQEFCAAEIKKKKKRVLILFLWWLAKHPVMKTFIWTFSKSAKTEWEGQTYIEFLISLKLGHDFFSDLVVRDAQVLPDVAVVAHQGHVVIGDVEQLQQTNSNTGSHQTATLPFGLWRLSVRWLNAQLQ